MSLHPAMTGAMMNNCSLEQALEVAVDYTVESIRKTMEDPEHRMVWREF